MRTRRFSLSAPGAGAIAATLLLVAPEDAAAAEICVDARFPGGGDGSRAAPFSSIQDAVWAAGAGDVVKVAGTQYQEAIAVETPNLVLEGGYAGATGDVYAGGGAGDFDTHDGAAYPTVVEGWSGEPVFTFHGPGSARLADMTVRGGDRGIYADGVPIEAHQLTVEGCIVEQNGDPGLEGGGILAYIPIVVRGCAVRDNVGDRGAGIMSEESLVVESSAVENNVGHGDHGGGIYAAGEVRVLGSVIRGNRTGESTGYGWGGGILVYNEGSYAELRGNVVTGNHAPTHGSGEFIDDGAVASIHNELIVDNVCGSGEGAGLYVDGLDESTGSTVDLVNVTIAGHPCSGSNAILVDRGSTVTMTSSIAWNNGGSSFAVLGGSSLTVRHSDVEDLGSMSASDGGGNLQVDPELGDPAAGDYHLRSTRGRPDAGGGCVVDATTSPCIDAGDPAGDFAAEPEPNGGRVDMGAYGNSPLASCDPSAVTVTTTAGAGASTVAAGPSTGPGAGGGDGGSTAEDDDGGSPVGGGDGGGDGADGGGEGDGCGCETVANPARPGPGIALGAIAAFCLARRRRRARA